MTLKKPLTEFGMLVYYINFVLVAFLEVSWTCSKIIYPTEDRGLSSLVQNLNGLILGSVLGPLLFLIFINDIVNEIGSNIRLFAGDTSLYIIVENPHSSALLLNSDLQKISEWADN